MPADSASIKLFVPDLAIVPRQLIKSALVIPTPVSISVSVFASRFGTISICKLDSDDNLAVSVRDSYRILSRASDAFETNSRKKTSLLL